MSVTWKQIRNFDNAHEEPVQTSFGFGYLECELKTNGGLNILLRTCGGRDCSFEVDIEDALKDELEVEELNEYLDLNLYEVEKMAGLFFYNIKSLTYFDGLSLEQLNSEGERTYDLFYINKLKGFPKGKDEDYTLRNYKNKLTSQYKDIIDIIANAVKTSNADNLEKLKQDLQQFGEIMNV